MTVRHSPSTNEMDRFFFVCLLGMPSVQADIVSPLCSSGAGLFLAHVRNILATLVLFTALPVFMPD